MKNGSANNSNDKHFISAVFSSAVKTSISQCPKPKKTTTKKSPPSFKPPLLVKSDAAETKAKACPSKSTGDAKDGWIKVATKNKTKVAPQTKNPPRLFKKGKALDQSSLVQDKKKKALASNSYFVPKQPENALPGNGKAANHSLSALEQAKIDKKKLKCYQKNQRRNRRRAEQAKLEKAALLQAQTKSCGKVPVAAPVGKDTISKEDLATEVVPNVSTQPKDKACLLFSLSYDTLTEGIVSYLRPEDISNFSRCSQYSKRIGEEGYLWQSMFKQRFPLSQLSPKNMQEWKLAYQLTLSNIVDHLRCSHTKKTFFEDTHGVGVRYTVNPKTKVVDYIDVTQDLLSETAFREHKIRTDVFGNKFRLFLPLYFSEDHFRRALPHIQKTLVKLCPRKKCFFFDPSMVLDVFPKIITTFSVLLSDEGISASRKSFDGLTRIHRLFLALAHEYPSIKREATMRLKLFATQENLRVKSACPNLGAILPLFMIVDQKDFGWANLKSVYVEETLDRGVLWVCKKHPLLEKTHDKDGAVESIAQAEERVDSSRDAMSVTLRLLMFNVYMARTCCQGTTQERANQYDRFFGQPDGTIVEKALTSVSTSEEKTAGDGDLPAPVPSPQTLNVSFSTFREQINHILSVSTWHEFFRFVDLPCPPTKAGMARILRKAVLNSRRKKYHTAGMDFSRVQKSGTSAILSKGQEYSASKSLQRVTFTDVWGFEGSTKYLDATCLLYQGKFRVATVDYRHVEADNGSVSHSGDVMQAGGGSHTIDINLQALDPKITSLFFVISAWANATLNDIMSPSISFTDADAGPGTAPLCKYDLDAQDKISHLTSVIMCKLYRTKKNEWHVQAIGDAHRGAADEYGPIYEAVDKLV